MARKHLFTTIAEIQKYYPFQDNDGFFQDLEPTLARVERKYLVPEIDPITWASIITEIDKENPTNATWTELVDRVSHAAAHLTALYHLDKANVVYSAGGLLITNTDHLSPASEFRTQQLRKSLFRDVQDALDQVIDVLEDNTAVFTDWAVSEHRTAITGQLIRTAAEFDRHYSIGESRYLFRKLLPSQRYVIESRITAAIGEDFLAAYITDLGAGLSNENKKIQPKINSALAHLTMGHAVPRIQQQFGAEGVALFLGEFHISTGSPDAAFKRISFLRDAAMVQGESDLADLKHYLDRNATSSVYADYFTSDSYQDPSEDNTDLNDYDTDQNHYAL